jgi:hypothetical protein
MKKLKQVTWNQNHLKILFHLQKGLPINIVAEQTGLSRTLVKKINALWKADMAPTEVTDEMIQNAPKPVNFGEYDLNAGKTKKPKQEKEAKVGEKKPGEAPATVVSKKAPAFQKQAPPILHTTALELVNQTGVMPMTQDIQISYFLALRNGYEGELWEWLSFCSRDYWQGRGHNMYAEYAEAQAEQEEELVAESS